MPARPFPRAEPRRAARSAAARPTMSRLLPTFSDAHRLVEVPGLDRGGELAVVRPEGTQGSWPRLSTFCPPTKWKLARRAEQVVVRVQHVLGCRYPVAGLLRRCRPDG